MIKITDNYVELELKDKAIVLKPAPFSKYNDLVKLFDELLEFQIKVEFSIAHIIADKKCLERLNKILRMLRTDGDTPLNIDMFEDNLQELCELFFGITKIPDMSLQQAFWAWAYPNDNRVLGFLEKFQTMPEESILKELLREARTPDLAEVFKPPHIAVIHGFNWFTDFLKLAKKVNREILESEQASAIVNSVEQNAKSISAA